MHALKLKFLVLNAALKVKEPIFFIHNFFLYFKNINYFIEFIKISILNAAFKPRIPVLDAALKP